MVYNRPPCSSMSNPSSAATRAVRRRAWNTIPEPSQVARSVAALVHEHLPRVCAEHVGSTSVPGCAGKGIVDLMIAVADGEMAAVTELLDRLGFQRQTGEDAFPETRPMRVGSFVHDGETFLVHVHVIPAKLAGSGRDAILSRLPASRPGTAARLRRPEARDPRRRRDRFAGVLQAQGGVHQGDVGIDSGWQGAHNFRSYLIGSVTRCVRIATFGRRLSGWGSIGKVERRLVAPGSAGRFRGWSRRCWAALRNGASSIRSAGSRFRSSARCPRVPAGGRRCP